MPPSAPLVTLLTPFQSLFSAPTWRKVQRLIIGTLLARGRRTVTAALRHTGQGDTPSFSLYHQVLNHARWSALKGSRRGPFSPRVRTTGQRTSCQRTSNAGVSRRPSRKAVPIWASRRSGNGRTWRPSGPRPVCWVCIRWWHCWRTVCTWRVAYRCAGSPGMPSSRRRSAMPWQRCVTICGRLNIFQHPRPTPSAWKFPGHRCSA